MDKTKKGSDLDFDLDLDLNDDTGTDNKTIQPVKPDNEITLDEIDLKIYRADGEEFKPSSPSDQANEQVTAEIEAKEPATTHQPEKPVTILNNWTSEQDASVVKKQPPANITHDKTVVINLDTIDQTSTSIEEHDSSQEFEEITIHSQYLFKDSLKQNKPNSDTNKQGNTDKVSLSRHVDVKGTKSQPEKKESEDHKAWYYAIALVLILFLSLIAWVYFKLTQPSKMFADNNVTTIKEQRQLPIGEIRTRKPVKVATAISVDEASVDNTSVALPKKAYQTPSVRNTSTETSEKERSAIETMHHSDEVRTRIKKIDQNTSRRSIEPAIKTKQVWALNLPSVPDNREQSYAELDRILSTGIPAEIYEIEIKNIRWYRIRIKGFDSEKAATRYMDTVTEKTGVKKYWINLISVPVD